MRSCSIVDMFRLINSTICKYPIVMIRPTKGATIKTWISGKNPTIYMHSFLLTMCKHICHNSKHYIFQKMSGCFIVDMFCLINSTICKNIYRMIVGIRKTIMATMATTNQLLGLSNPAPIYKTLNGQNNFKKRSK